MNIIPDGPTHGQRNNTGIKGDKGLAVVHNGGKEYEIEKEELVLNLRATETAEKLNRQYKKTKDSKYLKTLGDVMKKELLNNTYDYSKKFKVNAGKPLKIREQQILTRPKAGKYDIKESDIKAEGGKMQVLGNSAEVMMNMSGGERIFSRKHTKRLIELAKTGDKVKLGKYMCKVINTQDTQEDQFVETKK